MSLKQIKTTKTAANTNCSTNYMTPVFNGRRFKTLDLFDDNENFWGYTTMIELYNAIKIITMLLFIKKISRFNLGVAFLKSVSICQV